MASRRASGEGSAVAQRLLDAAWLVVRDHGLHAASSRAITDAAGVNLASITYHFGSKDQLIAESLIGQVRRWLQPALDALADTGAEPTHRLLRAVLVLNESFVVARQDSAVLLDTLSVSRHLPILRREISALLAELRAQLARHLADPSFGLPEWVQPDVYAGLLVAIGTGIAITSPLDAGGPSPAEMTGQLAATLLAARTPTPIAPGKRSGARPARPRPRRTAS